MRILRVAAVLVAGGLLGGPALAGNCQPQVEVEPNGGPANASPIALLNPNSDLFVGIAGAIDVPGDQDWYSFSGPAGARLWLAVDTGAAASGNRDSVLAVFRPDGTTLLEQDDDDGTGNGRNTTTESLDASLIAGLVLPTTGTYFARVQAKSPAATIDRYVLMASVNGIEPENEVEPNDTIPLQPHTWEPILGTLSDPADVDLYRANVLDHEIPFVVVDGYPERKGIGADVVLEFENGGTVIFGTDSSLAGSPGDPPAEGFAITELGIVKITGTFSFPGPVSYLLGVLYSGEECPVPVELQSLEIR